MPLCFPGLEGFSDGHWTWQRCDSVGTLQKVHADEQGLPSGWGQRQNSSMENKPGGDGRGDILKAILSAPDVHICLRSEPSSSP